MTRYERDYIKDYEEFWKGIVENEDGTLNKDQVMRELSDYSMILDNCAKAYYTMTDGVISKQNTKFFGVENIFNQNYTRTEYYDELEEENKHLKEDRKVLFEENINKEQLIQEQIRRIDMCCREIDEVLIYNDFQDTTSGIGNIPKDLKEILNGDNNE